MKYVKPYLISTVVILSFCHMNAFSAELRYDSHTTRPVFLKLLAVGQVSFVDAIRIRVFEQSTWPSRIWLANDRGGRPSWETAIDIAGEFVSDGAGSAQANVPGFVVEGSYWVGLEYPPHSDPSGYRPGPAYTVTEASSLQLLSPDGGESFDVISSSIELRIEAMTTPLASASKASDEASADRTPEGSGRQLIVSPNPFNPETEIVVESQVPGRIVVEVVDTRGRRIVVLMDEVAAAGRYAMTWRGKDGNGARASSGIYYVRAIVGEATHVAQVALLK